MRLALEDSDVDRLVDLLADRIARRVADHLSDVKPIDRWMTSSEAAEYLGLASVDALHKLTSARAIPFAQEKPGARCYFRRADLDTWRGSHGRHRAR